MRLKDEHSAYKAACPSKLTNRYSFQFTRDALIVLAGSKEKGRDFVYFTEVKDIPSTDLATIERLWNKFSGGKFGFSVQKVSLLGL